MSVDQERGSGGKAGRHGLCVAGILPDQDKPLPGGTVAFGFGPELVEEGFLEFQDFLHVHTDDAGFSRGGGAIGEDYVFEVVAAGRKDGGALVDLGGIEQVEDGEVLDVEDLVHALDGEAALAVEEVGDVGLFEAGLLGEAVSGKFSCLNSLQKDFSEVILQGLELH